MDPLVSCDLCGHELAAPSSYVVRIDAFADPSMPAMTSELIAQTNFDAELDSLLEQMKALSAEELQDQVHRRMEFRLCPACHRKFLANPLGKPRRNRIGLN
jgi:hypothetical protein